MNEHHSAQSLPNELSSSSPPTTLLPHPLLQMHTHLLSPSGSIGLIVAILIFIAISTCYSQEDQQYYDCNRTNYSCGPSVQNITYPFWGDGRRPQFCGHQMFELKCHQDEYPTIDINNWTFRVLEINQTSNLMTIARPDFWDNHCPRELFNLTYDVNNLLRYSLEVRPLFIFYGCTHNNYSTYNNFSGALANTFSCPDMDGNGKESWGFYTDESFLRVQLRNLTESAGVTCNASVVVPLRRAALERLSTNSSTLQEALNQGFELVYYAENTACLGCENSGGICGSDSNSSKFLCHCGDHTDPQNCRRKNDILNVRAKLLIGLGLIGFTILLLGLLFFFYHCRSKKRFWASFKSIFFWRKSRITDDDVEAFLKINGSLALKRYTYSSIKRVTNSFQDKLGKGGYGGVYKGKLLDGRLVAVKLLNETKGDGEEFINEVASISRTSHVNIVSLVGYCFEGRKRALIYEYMPNGSLEKFIYSKKSQQTNNVLEWNTMHKIVVGVAQGLDYLHRGCGTRIFHFDIKPHNILLDEEFCPKISDFGLAKLCPKKESIVSMLYARGTVGYIAPEVFSRQFGRVSHKADVYSYGMLVLEMVGVRDNIDECVGDSSEIYFPHLIYKKLECDGDLGLCGIKSVEDEEVARKMILVGLWCIQAHPSDRPAMNKVIEMLEGNLESLQVPPQPFLSSPSRSAVVVSTIQISEENESNEIE